MRRPAVMGLCLGTLLGAWGCGSEAPRALSPEEQALAEQIERRQANLQDLGAAFKNIRDLVEAGLSDRTLLEYSARAIQRYASSVHEWFPEGSGPELGVETEASPEIWKNPGEFQEEARRFARRSEALLEATRGRDDAATVQEFEATGESCKSCHDRFRIEED